MNGDPCYPDLASLPVTVDGVNLVVPPQQGRGVVEDCLRDTGDGCVTIKAGKDQEAWRIGRPCENVVVRYCRAIGGHGIFVIGSEMSGGVRNIYVHDCQSDGTNRGVRIKSRRGRGGAVENIYVRDVAVGNVRREAIDITMRYDGEPAERAVNYEQTHANSTATPIFRNLHFSNIGCGYAAVAAQIEGLPDQPIEDLTMENVVIAAERGMSIKGVKGLHLDRLTVVPRQGPTLTLSDVQDVTIG